MQYYIDSREVDKDSAVIEDIRHDDFPAFSDALIQSACFIDGGELSDSELDELGNSYPELVNELAHDEYHNV
jgi:hypothetical protein